MDREKKELIVVTHPIHGSIDHGTIDALTSSEWKVRDIVEICPRKFSLADAAAEDFFGLAREQERAWRDRLDPLLGMHPNAAIGYFGLAPVPLIFHLGSLVERFREVVVFQAHHETHEWFASVPNPAVINTARLLGAESASEEPIAITISVTRGVDRLGFLEAAGNPQTVLDCTVDPCGEDHVGQPETLQIAREFSRVLQWMEEKRPRSKETHIAAAVPCGVAFALGAQVTSTRHGQFVLYQYVRPHHREVLRLPLPARVEAPPPTAEEIETAGRLRQEWEISRLALLDKLASTSKRPWFSILGTLGDIFSYGRWRTLQTLGDTPFSRNISDEGNDEPEFRLDPELGWVLGVGLLGAMSGRLESDQLASAGRMLLLHEALHHGDQKLNSANARGMRLHPRVLEEVDYLSDVWAILHEFAFQGGPESTWPAQRNLLCRLIATALETMWAFDEAQPHGTLEVRRVSRYLLWYVNWARLERAEDLESAFQMLSEKPIVDLVGPEVRIEEGRIVMRLNKQPLEIPEVGILKDTGEVKRLGNTAGFKADELARALGKHDGSAIRRLTRNLVELW